MNEINEKYFRKSKFTAAQIKTYLSNAYKDLEIARESNRAEVKFNYSYTALIKAGIAVIAGVRNAKVRSISGHHVKIIEVLSKILNDDSISAIGNAMRSKRNLDLYGGGIIISKKESEDYYEFVKKVLERIKSILEKEYKERNKH